MDYKEQPGKVYHLYQQLVDLSTKLGVPPSEPRIHPNCTYDRLNEEIAIISLQVTNLQHLNDVQKRDLALKKGELEKTLIQLDKERLRKRRGH